MTGVSDERERAMTTDLLGHVAGFEAVSLQELEARAALQTRVDRKYIVDYETLERLFSELGNDYLALEIDGERLQQYDSVYFDTPELLSYKDHLQGRRKRFKSRTRMYGGTACFFDLKMKGRRGETVKGRLPLSAPEHGSLTGKASAFLKRGLLKEYGCAAPAGLVPTLQTSFERLTLIHSHQPERMTLDFGITFSRVGSGKRHRMRPGHVLIETKSGSQLGTVDRILLALGARPLNMCSKYSLGVALANPALPTNPYRPLLRRYFDSTPLSEPLPPLTVSLPSLTASPDPMPVLAA
jgi:VTC domain-containing protein